MHPYDSRRITLDSGLTALALRGLRSRSESYPFIERYARWRHASVGIRRQLAAWFPTVRLLLADHRR